MAWVVRPAAGKALKQKPRVVGCREALPAHCKLRQDCKMQDKAGLPRRTNRAENIACPATLYSAKEGEPCSMLEPGKLQAEYSIPEISKIRKSIMLYSLGILQIWGNLAAHSSHGFVSGHWVMPHTPLHSSHGSQAHGLGIPDASAPPSRHTHRVFRMALVAMGPDGSCAWRGPWDPWHTSQPGVPAQPRRLMPPRTGQARGHARGGGQQDLVHEPRHVGEATSSQQRVRHVGARGEGGEGGEQAGQALQAGLLLPPPLGAVGAEYRDGAAEPAGEGRAWERRRPFRQHSVAIRAGMARRSQ